MTFDEDGFADFESDEEPMEATTNDATTNDDAPASLADPMAPLSSADRAQFDAQFDAYTTDAPSGSSGLSGAQLVQITASAGVPNADLSLMWQLVAAPGADALRRDDFAIFCHLLRQRAAGAPLPPSIDASTRSRFFEEAGGETKEEVLRARDDPDERRSAATLTTTPSPIVVVVESVRGVKEASKMQNVSVALRLVTAGGEPIEAPRATPMGAATVRAGGVIVFEAPVRLHTTYDALPPGASLVLELKHFKKPKMSVKCWAAFDARAVVKGGRAETKKLAKPVKPDAASAAKAKPWMKSGERDVAVRFE